MQVLDNEGLPVQQELSGTARQWGVSITQLSASASNHYYDIL